MSEVKSIAYLWNEGDAEKKEINLDEEAFRQTVYGGFDRQLDNYDYGLLVRSRDDIRYEFYFRAFTDPYRGRRVVSGLSLEECNKALEQEKAYCKQKVFSANELYRLYPTETRYDLYRFVNNWLGREGLNLSSEELEKAEATKKLSLRYLVNRNLGSDESWTLASAWFDDQPFMVLTYSGEDWDYERYITDLWRFNQVIEWLRSFSSDKNDNYDVISADAALPQLTEFYGRTLHDFYDVLEEQPREEFRDGPNTRNRD